MPNAIRERATHVVCNASGDIVASASSEAVAVALAKRHGPGAYVATDTEESLRSEVLRELAALAAMPTIDEDVVWVIRAEHTEDIDERQPRCRHGFARKVDGYCVRCDDEHTALVAEARENYLRVTQVVADEPAKLVVGFTEGRHLAKRSRSALRRAGIAVPDTTSPDIISELVREAGYEPVIVPAATL